MNPTQILDIVARINRIRKGAEKVKVKAQDMNKFIQDWGEENA